MRLKDLVILVTGVGQGIGKAIALCMAKEGAILIAVDINKERLGALEKELKDIGVRFTPIVGDVSKKEDVQRMVDAALKGYGRIDGVINNAAVGYLEPRPHPLLETSEEEWDRQTAINLKSIYLTSRAALPEMIKQKRGKIVNIASIAGVQAIPLSAAYCAVKAGVANLTRSMAVDYGKYGIYVNAIAPGTIETLTGMNRYKLDNPEVRKSLLDAIPLGRFGTPEDIGRAAVFLASSDSDFITGHVLVVDGGRTIW